MISTQVYLSMLYGKDYIAIKKGLPSIDDDVFWTYLELDIAEIANEIPGVYIESCTDYVAKHKQEILKVLRKEENPLTTYGLLIRQYAHRLAMVRKRTKEFAENDSLSVSDLGEMDRIDSIGSKIEATSKLDHFDKEEPDQMLARITKRIQNYTFLTETEKQAVLYKHSIPIKSLTEFFTEEGIRQIALRAMLKVRLFELKRHVKN